MLKLLSKHPEIIIEDNAIEQIPDVLRDFKSILVVTGKKTHSLFGEKISKLLSDKELNFVYVEKSDENTLEKLKKQLIPKPDLIVGMGGGKNIDVARALAYFSKNPYITIPTLPSHDGIASNRSVISKGDKKYPIVGESPLAVIADLDVLSKAPFRFFSAGCGDSIAKYTSVLDWRLARDEKQESYDDIPAKMAYEAADSIFKNAEEYKKDYKHSVELLVKALISCGNAMKIANSSRPCSGAEHMFCHTVDHLYPGNTALHGEKVGLGTYIMSFLHGIDYEIIKNALVSYGVPINSKQIKIPPEILIKSLSSSHTIRSDMRYTILKDGINETDAQRILKKLDVI